MTEIDIIKEIKNNYQTADLNEAETRFKVIDVIIEKYLAHSHLQCIDLFLSNFSRA